MLAIFSVALGDDPRLVKMMGETSDGILFTDVFEENYSVCDDVGYRKGKSCGCYCYCCQKNRHSDELKRPIFLNASSQLHSVNK